MTNERKCKCVRVQRVRIRGHGNKIWWACRSCGQIFTKFLDPEIFGVEHPTPRKFKK